MKLCTNFTEHKLWLQHSISYVTKMNALQCIIFCNIKYLSIISERESLKKNLKLIDVLSTHVLF